MNAQAILILDIQDDFTGAQARMPVDAGQAAEMIGNLNDIISRHDEIGLKLVYIGNEFGKWDPANIFRNFAAVKGTAGTKLDSRLLMADGKYFSKNRGNAFSNPELDKYLKSLGINDIVVTGLMAQGCVKATVKAAIKMGYKVSVLEDCIASTSAGLKNKMVEKFKGMGVEVKLSADLFQQ